MSVNKFKAGYIKPGKTPFWLRYQNFLFRVKRFFGWKPKTEVGVIYGHGVFKQRGWQSAELDQEDD